MGSSLTTTWFDLIFAQPGAGKSVLMNALNLGTVLSAAMRAPLYCKFWISGLLRLG
jgi:hypothetical protein